MATRNGTSGRALSSYRPISRMACSMGSSRCGSRSASAARRVSSSAWACHTPSMRAQKYSRSARAISSASPNSCTRSCHGQAFSCQRYKACSASLRATLRVPLYSRALCTLTGAPQSQPRHQAGHLERGLHRLPALVTGAGGGALQRLLERFHREHAEGNRYAGLEARQLQAARAFTGHIVKVRRVAADHTPERHERVITTAGGQLAGRDRQLERARYAHHRQVRGRAAVLEPRAGGALEQTRHDEIVETRRDDRDFAAARVNLAFDELRGDHPSSPT